jgi:hypothetical protein
MVSIVSMLETRSFGVLLNSRETVVNLNVLSTSESWKKGF